MKTANFILARSR